MSDPVPCLTGHVPDDTVELPAPPDATDECDASKTFVAFAREIPAISAFL